MAPELVRMDIADLIDGADADAGVIAAVEFEERQHAFGALGIFLSHLQIQIDPVSMVAYGKHLYRLAAPVQIEVPDLPTAFATGRVDVMITSASTGVQSKAEEYLTHYYDTQAWLPRNVVFMNKKTYDALSADQRKAVTAAAKVAEERGWKASIEEMTIKTAALKKAGIKVQPPSPALRDGLRKIGKTLSDDWVKSAGADGKAMLDAYAK